jgi:hypothetical protein
VTAGDAAAGWRGGGAAAGRGGRGTLQRAAADLNAEDTDYVRLADDPTVLPLGRALETPRQFLSESPEPMTRHAIFTRWPQGEPPHPDSLWRTLSHPEPRLRAGRLRT